MIAAPVLLAAGVATAAPVAAASKDPDVPKYKGGAIAIRVQLGVGGQTLLDTVLPDPIKFPTGGAANVLELPKELSQVATLQVLDESAGIGRDNIFAANAHTAGLSVLGNLVGALVLNSDCTANRREVRGDSQVAGLTLLGNKIPVDPGPNFAVEITDALKTLISGGIYIDEQSDLPDGGKQIRALHVHLVVAPSALQTALNSAIAEVRAVAEHLTTAVENATGETLNTLLAQTHGAGEGTHGALAEKRVRAAAKAEHSSRETSHAKVAAPVQQAAPAAHAAPQAPVAAAAPAAAQSASTAQTGTTKADGAAIDRHAATESATQTDATASRDQAMDERAERGAKTAEQAQDAQQAAATQQASAQNQQTAADSAAAAQRAQTTERTVTANREAKQAADAKAATTREETRAKYFAHDKGDGADLSVAERASAPKVTPQASDDVAGLVGVDVIVSQVDCTGAELLAKHHNLPKTGGDSKVSRDLAASGLALLMAGSAAVYAVRRRGRHHLG
jgi:chemotaxis protein histidine kinase CheA